MRVLKLFVLAMTIGIALLCSYWIYPDRLNRVFTGFSTNTTSANVTDFAVFLESVSLGFTVGFAIFLRLSRKASDLRLAKEVRADKRELESVFFFLTGLCFVGAGIGMLAAAVWHGLIQIMLGSILVFYPPLLYFYAILRRRRNSRSPN